MEILSQKYPGLYFICEQCGGMIGNVKNNEIYEGNCVYCPICHWKNKLEYNTNYDGIIKNDSKFNE